MKNKPLVSVIIPTLPHRKKVLERALKSIKSQTYSNLEIITVTEGHSGGEARNIGISKAKGKYVAFLDDDDTWEPTKIQKQLKEFEKHPVASICITYSSNYVHDAEPLSTPPPIITHKMLIKSFNMSTTSTFLVRRETLNKLKETDGCCFDEKLKSGQEYDFAIRATKNNHYIITVEEALVNRYASEGRISDNWNKKISGTLRIYKKYHSEYSMQDHVKTLGLLLLFLLGHLLGARTHKVLLFIKRTYEHV